MTLDTALFFSEELADEGIARRERQREAIELCIARNKRREGHEMVKKKAHGFDVSFDFGASAKPRKKGTGKKKSKGGKRGGKGNAWTAYTKGPLPL
jgi:hypothetical protein